MWLKKRLLIILIVALVIFGGSLAFGLQWQYALLISIVFLLIAALVFGGGGLLIPEGLFGMFSPRRLPMRPPAEKPTEAAEKTEFLKKMEATLTDLSEQREVADEDARWMEEYARVVREVGELAYEVHQSVRSKDRAKQSRAFREAVKRLPQFISEFQDMPEPESKQAQKATERQTKGMDLYLLACSNFAEAIEGSDGELAGLAAKQITEALTLLDLMERPSATNGWG